MNGIPYVLRRCKLLTMKLTLKLMTLLNRQLSPARRCSFLHVCSSLSLSLSVCTCEGFFSSCRFLWMACMINTLNCSLFGNFRNFVYFVWKISKFFWKYWLYFNPYFAFDSFFFSNTSRNIQSPKFQPVCNCQWIRLQTQYKRRLSCRNVYLWFGLK